MLNRMGLAALTAAAAASAAAAANPKGEHTMLKHAGFAIIFALSAGLFAWRFMSAAKESWREAKKAAAQFMGGDLW
jgi:hypothetical protein